MSVIFPPTELPPPSLACFPNENLWKIRENYVNDTAFPQKRKARSQEEKMQRAMEAWGVGTSSGISLGNLWIIPTVLMKVVRIRNAEIQGEQHWCEGAQMVK